MAESDAPAATDHFLDEYPELDAISFQVIGSALEAICREMGVTTIRTATSPIIVDVLDFSCALLDHDGQLAATANYDPSHLSAIGFAVEAGIREFGFGDVAPGDVLLHNDPYLGGTHIPDFTVIRPIFVDDELLGFAANRAHHVDAGGKAAGGFAADAKEIYAEGLRVPVVRWYHRGLENEDLFRTVLLNIRIPELQEADFRAQLASCETAAQRVAELCNRYGAQTVVQGMAARQDYAERLMRSVIERIPDGSYHHSDFIDDDANDSRGHRISVTITVDGSDVVVNFAGSSRQSAGPTNSAYGMTWASTFNALLQLSPPDMPFNGGCFRPVHVKAPRGSLLTPAPPAPVFAGTVETSLRTIDAIVGALIRVMPDEFVAATYGTAFCLGGGGFDPDRCGDFAFFFIAEGGWGGSSTRDGWDCTPNQTSNFKDTPVEVIEQRYPFRCDEVRLRCDSAGAGRHRGGLGTIRRYQVLSGEVRIGCYSDRFRTRPYGVFGGFPGMSNDLRVDRLGEGKTETFVEAFGTSSPSKFSDVTLRAGDRFSVLTGGGGGYGSPLERDPQAVLADCVAGVVSPESACDHYGVMLRGNDVDRHATAARRASLAEQWLAEPLFVDLEGHVTVDETYAELLRSPERCVPVAEDTSTAAVRALRARVDESICETSCVRRGDPRVCPWHSDRDLTFLSIDVLMLWSKMRCPQFTRLSGGRTE
jgi:N-methylhydantoinase B/oxoprolinase/acetone carboxylase alpha subunit